ncbi:MAG: hypothetical protein AB7D27_09900 [Desulfomicrobium sp.]
MERRWITGDEILVRWQGLDFELANAFLTGSVIDGKMINLEPIDRKTGKHPIHICMSCEYSTFEGMPGDHYFGHTRRYACDPAPGQGCCYAALPLDVLAGKLRLHHFLMKDVLEFEVIAGMAPMENHADQQRLSGASTQEPEESSIVSAMAESRDGLSLREKQELGRLRAEKEKWDLSLRATISIALSLSEGKRATKEDLWGVLKEQGIFRNELPDTTFLKIWSLIPQQFKSLGGRPKRSEGRSETP